MMNMSYLHDRRCTIPAVLTALVIAVGSFLVIVLSSSASTTSPSGVPPGSTAPAAGITRVDIQNYKYTPETLTVRVGTKVAWTNQDSVPHSATVAGGFDTGLFAKGRSRTVTMARAGTFHYICTIHPFMHGTVVVR
jgi:plastocyanin